MIKKLFSIVMIVALVILLPACGKEKSLKSDNNKVTTKKAEIMVYLPEGQQLDNKYYNDKEVAINYLPNNKGTFTEKEVNDIVNNIDKHVKVLVITTEKTGLEGVFKKVKDKLPGVITVAGDIGEMHNDELYSILKNPKLDVAFTVENNKKGVESAKIAKLMGAEQYIYLSRTKSINPEVNEDMQEVKEYCNNNGMKFENISVDEKAPYSDIISKVKKTAAEAIKKTAVFPSDKSLSKDVLEGALSEGYMVPDINSENDGRLLSEVLNMTKDYKKLPREEFDSKVSQKLKEYNLNGKIAGISEGIYSIPSELTIEIAKFMYEKNYMIEECYRDVSVIARGNRNLKLSILPKDIGLSLGYARNLLVTPRIY